MTNVVLYKCEEAISIKLYNKNDIFKSGYQILIHCHGQICYVNWVAYSNIRCQNNIQDGADEQILRNQL